MIKTVDAGFGRMKVTKTVQRIILKSETLLYVTELRCFENDWQSQWGTMCQLKAKDERQRNKRKNAES